MRTMRSAIIATAIGVVAVVGCGGSSSNTSAPHVTVAEPCRVGSGIAAHATTKSYEIQLNVGPIETMYSSDQVASQHPTSGEVMLGGEMTSVGGMAGMPGMGDMPGMGGTTSDSAHHLEAHICSKASGAPAQNANPTIKLSNDATKNVVEEVPIAIMQGVGQSGGDYHYGNNVILNPGAAYTVVVSLAGETATFHIRIPAASSTTSTT